MKCPECDDTELDEVEDSFMCMSCGCEIDAEAIANAKKFHKFVAGKVISIEPLKGKLSKAVVQVKPDGDDDDDDEGVVVVTNARNVREGDMVIAAMIGAIVPAGAVLDEDPNAFVVKKSSVGGISSYGVLCDSPMLGWIRGTTGCAAKLPASYEIGTAPPPSKIEE